VFDSVTTPMILNPNGLSQPGSNEATSRDRGSACPLDGCREASL